MSRRARGGSPSPSAPPAPQRRQRWPWAPVQQQTQRRVPDPPLIGLIDGFVVLAAAVAAALWWLAPALRVPMAVAAGCWLLREALGAGIGSMNGETVVITGAGSGIGRLMAHRFAKAGCNLVLWDLNGGTAEDTAAECQALGAHSLAAAVDVSDFDAVSAAASAAIKRFGQVDCLINNAGIVSGMRLLDVPPALAGKTLDVNVKALM